MNVTRTLEILPSPELSVVSAVSRSGSPRRYRYQASWSVRLATVTVTSNLAVMNWSSRAFTVTGYRILVIRRSVNPSRFY